MLATIKRLVPEPIKNAYHFLQALFGALFFRFPSRQIKVIGVTGTDGKTTTVYLIHHILNESGINTSMISTVEAKIGDKVIDTGLHVTTPNPFKVQNLLRKIADAGSEYAVLEVTSHGLAQERVAFVKFFAGIVTNITHEHLDYHKTYNNYLDAKAKILNGTNCRILNRDDTSFKKLHRRGTGHLITYGVNKDADFKAENISSDKQGLKFTINYKHKKISDKVEINTKMTGKYNIYNMLAAFVVAVCLGVEKKKIVAAINNFTGVRGRMQYVDEGQGFDVIIDFAHTPAALENILKYLHTIKEGKIIAVFGSAGERDVGKRTMMGKVATELANLSVFTAEDPRSEDVNQIINQMAGGAVKAGGIENRTFFKIPDRVQAINTAIQTLAADSDTVVILGKGHEKSMNIGSKEYPWSDELITRNSLKTRLKR